MKAILLGSLGFAVGAIAIVAVGQSGQPATSPMGGGMSGPAAMRTTTMRGGTSAEATTPPAVALSIRHVRRGCHVWNLGGHQGPMMRISLPRGGRLRITDQDLDAHQLVELSGPRMRMPAAMAMMDSADLRFMRPGVYRLATKTVELPGATMPEAPTVGSDNHLTLLVTVA